MRLTASYYVLFVRRGEHTSIHYLQYSTKGSKEWYPIKRQGAGMTLIQLTVQLQVQNVFMILLFVQLDPIFLK